MAKRVKFRRGTKSECDLYTGPVAEIIVDTEDFSLRIHDGVTPGGHKIKPITGNLGEGDVKAPPVTTQNKVPQWDSTQKLLKDGLSVGTQPLCLVQLDGLSRLPAIDGSQLINLPIPTDIGTGDVVGPLSTTTGKVPQWSSTQKTLVDGVSIGTAPYNLVQLDSASKLPAVDGSLLLNVVKTDINGKIPVSAIPETLTGGLSYAGLWNAAANNPVIPSATQSNNGVYYKVSVAGNTSIDGISTWGVGDWIISNGGTWDRIENSVASSNGDVVAPPTTTQNKIPQWSSAQKVLTDGLTVTTTLATPGSNNNIPTELAVRSAIVAAVASAGGGDVMGPASTTQNKVPQWSSAQKVLTDGITIGNGPNNLVQLDSNGSLPATLLTSISNSVTSTVTTNIQNNVSSIIDQWQITLATQIFS